MEPLAAGYKVYDNVIKEDPSKFKSPMAPIGFTYKTMKYHVVLSPTGEFVSAEYLLEPLEKGKKKAPYRTIRIPATLRAGMRTSGKENVGTFPIEEQLQYLFPLDKSDGRRHQTHMDLVDRMCAFPGCPKPLLILRDYLKKNTLLFDLQHAFPEEAGLVQKGNSCKDYNQFVCFSVQSADPSNQMPEELWLRKDVEEFWTRAYVYGNVEGVKETIDLCCISGERQVLTTEYPKFLGNAKLISSDDSDYPARSRGKNFKSPNSAAKIGKITALKLVSAFDWLKDNQGFADYPSSDAKPKKSPTRMWCVFCLNGDLYPYPTDVPEWLKDIEEVNGEYAENTVVRPVDTGHAYAKAVRNAAAGLHWDEMLDMGNPKNQLCILGIGAYTKGRASYIYWQELRMGEYVEKLKNWYIDCSAPFYSAKDKCYRTRTPGWEEIAALSMGGDAFRRAKAHLQSGGSNALLKDAGVLCDIHEKLTNCIMYGDRPVRSLVQSIFRNACSPFSFKDGTGKWSRRVWEDAIQVACALISCDNARNPKFSADDLITNRSYLSGYNLAVADEIELEAQGWVYKTPTNALKYFQTFSMRPLTTWKELHAHLLSSFSKLGSRGLKYQKELEKIASMFTEEDGRSDKKLDFAFLLGFATGKQELWYQRRLRAIARAEKELKDAEEDDEEEAEGNTEEKAEDEPSKEDSNNGSAQAKPVPFEVSTYRDEIWGCMAAVAEKVELDVEGYERIGETKALKNLSALMRSPVEAWSTLHQKILPYLMKQEDRAGYYRFLLTNLERQFAEEDRASDKPLSGAFLHSYYRMRQALYQKTDFRWKPAQRPVLKVDNREALWGGALAAAEAYEMKVRWIQAECTADGMDDRLPNALLFAHGLAAKPAAQWPHLRRKLDGYRKYNIDEAVEGRYLKSAEKLLEKNGWITNERLNGMWLHYYYRMRE